MPASLPPSSKNRRLAAAVAALLGISVAPMEAGTFTWNPGTTGFWTTGANWGGAAPTGTNPTDILIFGGDVGTLQGVAPNYTATNNFGQPFQLNVLQLNATDNNNSKLSHEINGQGAASLLFTGNSPQILQNNAGNFNITLPVRFDSSLTVGGTGLGRVTLSNTVSGIGNITKTGTSVLRFGSASDTSPSDNRWVGALNIQEGAVAFNNNAASGRTALRANAVNITAGSLSASSELRLGTLSGVGSVSTNVSESSNADSESIAIHTLGNGVFSGSLTIGAKTGTGENTGDLLIRGSGRQEFTSFLQLNDGDLRVGAGATVVLSGNASLGSAVEGDIEMNGGTFILDNTGTNNQNRIRGTNLDTAKTAVDVIGGGTISLIGHTDGTQEDTGRLQLGSINNSQTVSTRRGGALNINVTHTGSGTTSTVLNFASYSRNSLTTAQFATVDFSAKNANGTAISLGTAATGAKITFGGFPVPLSNDLLTNTNSSATDVGWATVNGTDFATYGTNGVTAVTTQPMPGTGTGSNTANYSLTGTTSPSYSQAFSANTIRIEPTNTGQSITLTNFLTTKGILLAGSRDFTIGGTGRISSFGTGTTASTRYFYIQEATLNIGASVAGDGTIVKSGEGILSFNNTSSIANVNGQNPSMVVINKGVVRAIIGATASTSSLPNGELQLRGGVLEISGGGTFSRSVGVGSGSVNWTGFNNTTQTSIDDDQGSGGFSAIGGNATLDLGAGAQTGFAWEDPKFVDSAHALIFGSRKSDSTLTWVDNLSLSATSGEVNYNAREIRVINNENASVLTDRLKMSGAISGSVQNDLLKTGDGVLELAGSNTYQGATLVRAGTLLVNSSNQSSFLTDVYSGAKLGGRGTTGPVRVQAGGSIAPGDFQGFTGQTSMLNVSGDLRLAASSKLEFELALGSYDQLNVTGNVFLDGAELVGSLLNGFISTENDLFFLIINDGTDPIQGQLANGSLFTIGQQTFEVSLTGNSIANSFTGGNDLVVRPIPEPSTAFLLGSGLLLLGARRRRR